MKKKKLFGLTPFEGGLWFGSLCAILIAFLLAEAFNPWVLIASLIGATALIFVAKGYPSGQILTCVFALLYAYISWNLRYYSEMITYLGMTFPIALASAVSWIRHPFRKGESEVSVRKMRPIDWCILLFLTAIVTFGLHVLLVALDTPQLFWSTVSLTTSFLASSLTLLRSPFYAFAYAMNDIVLIVLWVLAATENPVYFPMVVCFIIFLINDGYGFRNWMKMQRRQKNPERGRHRT